MKNRHRIVTIREGGKEMKYLIKKTGTLIITLFIVSFLTFLAFSLIPGDPATSMLGTEATPGKLEALREEMGLNKPFLIRYFSWAKSFFMGDMGISYNYHLPVREILIDKVPITLVLTLMSFLIIVVISIPLGIFTASLKGKALDRIIMLINQIIMAVPGFFMGIILTLIFGLLFTLFSPGGYVSYHESIPQFMGYLIWPSIAIALPKIAMTVKLLRSTVAKELNSDYVRTAYSKGNSKAKVLYSHVLKNALIPVIAFLAMVISDIVAGSIIIEQVFSLPGFGRLLISSISNRDYPVVQAITVILATIIIVVNYFADILYQWIDPRIRLRS